MSDRTQELLVLRNAAALLGFGQQEQTFAPWLDLVCAERLYRLRPIHLVQFNYSRDWEDANDDSSEIVDVSTRRGTMSPKDKAKYGYVVADDDVHDFWFIHFEGSMVIDLICQDFELEPRDLKSHYPAIASYYQRSAGTPHQ